VRVSNNSRKTVKCFKGKYNNREHPCHHNDSHTSIWKIPSPPCSYSLSSFSSFLYYLRHFSSFLFILSPSFSLFILSQYFSTVSFSQPFSHSLAVSLCRVLFLSLSLSLSRSLFLSLYV
jgi:hypothetical protein